MNKVVYGTPIAKSDVVHKSPFKIEASQKGWVVAIALVEVIADFETGAPGWDKYANAKSAVLLALDAFEVWHGKVG